MELPEDPEAYLLASQNRRTEIAGQISRLRIEQDVLLDKELQIRAELLEIRQT